MGKRFYLRKAKLSDINIVYELRNDELVRHNSINQDKISFDTHKEWFLKTINDENVRFYLAFSDNDEFVGGVRLVLKDDDFWEVNISVSSEFRGKGFSSLILEKAIEISNTTKLIAYILDKNSISKKLFTKLGFRYIDASVINDMNVEKYIRIKDEK